MFLFSRGLKRLDFFFLLCVHVNFLPEVLGAVAVTSDQFTRVLNDLMKKPYDKRVRPLFNEGPLFVRLGVFLESVLDFNEQASELSITVTLKQSWLEPRLTFSRGLVPNDSVLIIPEQVKLLWNPNTIVVNQRKSIVMFENHESTQLISEGQVSTSTRMTLTTECIAQYSYFPFDTQSCDIEFTSYTKEIAFEWDDGNSGMKKGVQTPELQIASYSAHGFTRGAGDAHHSSPVFTILFVRKWNRYYLTFYSPMIIFTFVSLLSLWLFDYKLGVLINFLILPLVNIFIVIGNKVSGRPKTDVSTAMDQYASLCYFFMFMCAIVSAAELYFERQDSQPTEKKEDLKDKESEEDEESGSVHSQSQPDLPDPEVKQKCSVRLKGILAKVKKAAKILCYHSFWILLAGFLLCNVFYWGSNFSDETSKSDPVKYSETEN